MATQGTYYLNGATLSAATAVFTDVYLTTLAPDGYYSSGSVVRQQVAGSLEPETACPGCGVSALLCYSNISALDVCCNCATGG